MIAVDDDLDVVSMYLSGAGPWILCIEGELYAIILG